MRVTIRNIGRCSRAFRSLIIATLATVVLSACAESSRPEATGKGRVRGINAVTTSPELIFLNEERAQGTVNYRAVSGFTEWDDLSYNFNFDVLPAGASQAQRIASQPIDVIADTDHTIVLTGSLANPTLLTWESAEREWSGTETVFEVDFFHVSPLLGEVDIYYAPEGTVPVPGNEIATMNNGDRIPYQEFAEGVYELLITAPDDPSTILFQSSALTRSPAERITIGILDANPSIVAPIDVNIIFDGAVVQNLSDINSPAEIRLTHASFGVENINGYFDDDFGTAIFSNIAFGESSPYSGLSETETPFDVALVSAPATTVTETDVLLLNNTRRSLLFWGTPGAHFLRPLIHDARPVEFFAAARITNVSTNLEFIDIYIVEPDTVLDDNIVPSFAGAIPGISTEFFNPGLGMQEFVLTLPGEKTPIATPVVLDLASGDVVDMIIVDTADPAVVEMRIFDSIP